jgi:thiol:disulfide interchange protein DsbD
MQHDAKSARPQRRRDESRHGQHECLRRERGRARFGLPAFALLLLLPSLAQAQQHVTFDVSPPAAVRPGGAALVRIAARIDSGWHLYAASSASGIPISFATDSPAVARLRLLEPPPQRAYDANFQADSDTYTGEAAFLVELNLKQDAPTGSIAIPLHARFQTCSDQQCVPGKWNGDVALAIDPAAPAAAPAIPAGYAEGHPPAPAPRPPADQSAWGFFIVTAFGLGLASIFTPCVFPMIPITMSYFLNRPGGGRKDGVAQAVVFCLGIVVLFSGIGLAATAILGPAGVKNLGGNPWVNGFIAALFFAFGLSLLGAFEITIPSSILTRLNRSSEKGGFAGALLMGLTFSLASFACVGPFVGTLLAASVGGGGLRPLVGMVAFATGLALPFFLLALFPGYLKRMPRSGSWLARVKVVLGFVILAASLKYLASADQVLHWGFLTRERFIAAWVVLFAMAGLYLLGFLRLEGVNPGDRMGLGRLLTAIAFLVFALSLLPGMFGARLGELDAYIPEPSANAAAPAQSSGLVWLKDSYQQALEQARREGKLVFIDFTGYACTNCHWMRANMLSRPEIAAVLKNFVLVELYTDGADAASQANSKMQVARFGTIAEPFYVIETPDERVVATFDHLTKDPGEYLSFLENGASAAPAPAAAAGIPRVTSLEGAPIDPASFAGKVLVVNFWATYCVPCIQEIPSFNKVNREYSGRVAVLGVSMDEDPTLVPSFLKKHPMDYQVAMGSPDLTTPYGLDGLPVTLIYDKSGKPIKRFTGFLKEDEMESAIQSAL